MVIMSGFVFAHAGMTVSVGALLSKVNFMPAYFTFKNFTGNSNVEGGCFRYPFYWRRTSEHSSLQVNFVSSRFFYLFQSINPLKV